MLTFVTLPAVLFWVAYTRHRIWYGVAALALDVFWSAMQIQSWWLPYILGTNRRWQLAYAEGPTTKILPSFGNHVAPDGMHLMIHVLLVAAIFTGVAGLRQLRRPRIKLANEAPAESQAIRH